MDRHKGCPLYVMKNSALLLLIATLFIGSCEDGSGDIATEVIKEIHTKNINNGTFYFNLSEGLENSKSWHLAYEKINIANGLSIPSLALSNNSMLVIESSIDFELIQNPPAINSFSPEGGRMQYSGSHAVFSYNAATNNVIVSKSTYIVYDTILNKIFKVRFDQYNQGVAIFSYGELKS